MPCDTELRYLPPHPITGSIGILFLMSDSSSQPTSPTDSTPPSSQPSPTIDSLNLKVDITVTEEAKQKAVALKADANKAFTSASDPLVLTNAIAVISMLIRGF